MSGSINPNRDYRQCPFCDQIFEEPLAVRKYMGMKIPTPLEVHIRGVHKKVRVWKGRNSKWLDINDVNKHLGTLKVKPD